MFALVAESDGNLVGLAQYLFHRSTSRIASTCYLQDLFTLPAARGKGVGRAPELCLLMTRDTRTPVPSSSNVASD